MFKRAFKHRLAHLASNQFLKMDYLLEYESLKRFKVFRKFKLMSSIRNIDKTNTYVYMIWKRNLFSLVLLSSFTLISGSINIFILYLFYDRLIAQNKIELKQQIHSNVKFEDIIGIEEFKEELENIVIQLKNRRQFIKSGAKIPKGILLVGSPGCGKTQLARAVSGETNLPFY